MEFRADALDPIDCLCAPVLWVQPFGGPGAVFPLDSAWHKFDGAQGGCWFRLFSTSHVRDSGHPERHFEWGQTCSEELALCKGDGDVKGGRYFRISVRGGWGEGEGLKAWRWLHGEGAALADGISVSENRPWKRFSARAENIWRSNNSWVATDARLESMPGSVALEAFTKFVLRDAPTAESPRAERARFCAAWGVHWHKMLAFSRMYLGTSWKDYDSKRLVDGLPRKAGETDLERVLETCVTAVAFLARAQVYQVDRVDVCRGQTHTKPTKPDSKTKPNPTAFGRLDAAIHGGERKHKYASTDQQLCSWDRPDPGFAADDCESLTLTTFMCWLFVRRLAQLRRADPTLPALPRDVQVMCELLTEVYEPAITLGIITGPGGAEITHNWMLLIPAREVRARVERKANSTPQRLPLLTVDSIEDSWSMSDEVSAKGLDWGEDWLPEPPPGPKRRRVSLDFYRGFRGVLSVVSCMLPVQTFERTGKMQHVFCEGGTPNTTPISQSPLRFAEEVLASKQTTLIVPVGPTPHAATRQRVVEAVIAVTPHWPPVQPSDQKDFPRTPGRCSYARSWDVDIEVVAKHIEVSSGVFLYYF